MSNLDLIILKTLISNKKQALDFVNEHDAKLFSAEYWNFANLIINYIKTHKDLPTQRIIIEKLSAGKNETLIEKVKKTWEQLDKISIDSKEYKHELEKIKKRFAEKEILALKEKLSKLEPGNMDIGKAVGEMQKSAQNIRGLNNNKAYEVKEIKEYLPLFVDKFNAKKNNSNLDRGLLTKYSFIDYATNGIKPADFLVIAGETGFGKSLFLNNIAIQTWLQDNQISENNNTFTEGKNIIYFSLEMPYEDCFNRLLSRLSGVPVRAIENAKFSKEDFIKIKSCLDFINKYPFNFKIVDIADASANDLEAILIDSGESYDAIFIDYLGIMRTNEKTDDQDWLQQGVIAYEIRAIARKYKVPIFSAVQLNRKSVGKESSENIGLSRLARSATIATHVTHVIQIESRINEEKYGDFIFHFVKNRKGPKGKGVLIKNLACATLLDNTEINQIPDNSYENYFKDQEDISEKLELLGV